MPWTPITTEAVTGELSNAEAVGLTAAQANGLSVIPALVNILAGVVKSVRGFCIAGGNMVSSIPNTIPEQLWEETVAIARWRWICSVPKLKFMQTDERRELYKDAMDTLKQVANGAIKVELPTGAGANNVEASPVNQVEITTRAPRNTAAVSQSGIVIDRMRGLI